MRTEHPLPWLQPLDRQSSPLDGEGERTTQAPPSLEHQFTELVLPHDANHYGTLFGPNALALMGKAAFLAAARYSHQSVVMASAKQVDFLKPVPVGALLHVHGRVVRVGRSSMSVRVHASFDAAPGTRPDEVLRGAFEMVTVDEHGRPCPVAPPPRNEDAAFAAAYSLPKEHHD